MITLADVLARHGHRYLTLFGDKIPAVHRQAMRDILNCRVPDVGGRTWLCKSCQKTVYSYHSCNNRSCPQCQHHKSRDWLASQQGKLLPVDYFMVTFTLPAELRQLARSNQKRIFNIFFKTASASLIKLGRDPRFVGGDLAMIGVLQTWTRTKEYHPHIHFIVPGVALDRAGKTLCFPKKKFLVRQEPLGIIFRAKFRDELIRAGLATKVAPSIWKKAWIVNFEEVGNGSTALTYLAPYLFNGAISNRSIVACDDHSVTFCYKDSDSGHFKNMTLEAMEFLRRILQHVLPKGFKRIRAYGFLAPKCHRQLRKMAELLNQPIPLKAKTPKPTAGFKCPCCGCAMTLIDQVPRMRGPPLEVLLGFTERRAV